MDDTNYNENKDEIIPHVKEQVIQSIGKFVEKKSKVHLDSVKRFEQKKLERRRDKNRKARKSRKRNR